MDSTTPVLVDTDVISFIFSRVPGDLAGRSLTVSLITLAEIEYGMEAKNWGTRRRELMGRFLSGFKPLLSDIDTANRSAGIKRGRDKKGRPISFPDAWIAASALQMNIPPGDE
jgi:toxin FitB